MFVILHRRIFQLLAVLLCLQLVVLVAQCLSALAPAPNTVTIAEHDAGGWLRQDRTRVLLAGDCVQISWNVSNIESVRLGDAATVGEGSQAVCGQAAVFEIGFRNGVRQTYRLSRDVVLNASALYRILLTAVLTAYWYVAAPWHRARAHGRQWLTVGSLAVLLTVMLLAVTLLIIVQQPLLVNDDVAIFLQIGAKILAGQRPYVDYFESNPPMMHYVGAAAVFVGRLANVNAIVPFMWGMWLLIAASVVTSGAVLRAALRRLGSTPFEVWLIPFALAAQSLAIFWLDDVVPTQFGQREQIFVLLYVPLMLLRWARAEGRSVPRWLAFAVGFFGLAGVSIKPFFVVFPLLQEVYLYFAKRRDWRFYRQPEVYGALAFVGLVGVYSLFNFDVVTAYVFGVIPVVQSGYESFGSAPFLELVQRNFTGLFLLLLVPVVTRRMHVPVRTLLYVVALGYVAAVLAFAVQGKGWAYHAIPLVYMLLLLYLLLFSRVVVDVVRNVTLPWGRAKQFGALVVALTLVIVTGLVVTDAGERRITSNVKASLYRLLLDQSAEGDPVLIVSDEVSYIYPDIQVANRLQASRYLIAMPIPFAYHGADMSDVYAPSHAVPPLMATYLDDLREDIRSTQPALILLDDDVNCDGCDVNIDMNAYLAARGLIVDVVAPDYEQIDSIEHFTVYRRTTE